MIKRTLLTVGLGLLVIVTNARSQTTATGPAPCLNKNPGAGKYQPGTCNEMVGPGKTDCRGRCASGPMLVAPNPIEACEDEPIQVNIRILGGLNEKGISTHGDSVENQGGDLDWGDGKNEGINILNCCNWNFTHTYAQAKTYYLSATAAQQLTNANNPPGGCSYRCRVNGASTVIIHMETAPECAGGKLKVAQKPKP